MSNQANIIVERIERLVQFARRSNFNKSAEVELTAQQTNFLRIIRTHPGISVNELSMLAHRHQTTATTILNRLEARDLIVRGISPSSLRRRAIFLTTKGAELLVGTEEIPMDVVKRALLRLAPDDLNALDRGLRALMSEANIAR